MDTKGFIKKIAGPLIVAKNLVNARIYDVVKVGNLKLMGEVIKIDGDDVYIQVYEETTGLKPEEPVWLLNEPFSVELGPGLIGNIFDGVLRPLNIMYKERGDFISRGIEVSSLARGKLWDFKPSVKIGDDLQSGDIIGEVQETELVIHKIIVPPHIKGKVIDIKKGRFNVDEVICKLKNNENVYELKMYQKWPVRQPRPYKQKLELDEPLITGQRIIDTLFPLSKGGSAAIPGPFGSGKTVVQHQLAKWADADIIIFVGCGERGNEMTDVLHEFPQLKDPKSGLPLIKRTVLVANTSNMPVAAREASIYTGITLAEYYRDMGYSVAITVDSTSRWAEALREMGSRLEEMPGEEGYPAYLGSRTASFYERSGKVIALGADNRVGSVSIIGAVSPPGGDFSEPVTQNTLRVVKVFWALDDKLANKRHFPAINWLRSYSLYFENLSSYFEKNLGKDFTSLREWLIETLKEEEKLIEIVRLVGMEGLSDENKIILKIAQIIREDYLMQDAFDEIDTYCSLKKQYLMMKTIYSYYQYLKNKIGQAIAYEEALRIDFEEKIKKMRFIPENNLKSLEELINLH